MFEAFRDRFLPDGGSKDAAVRGTTPYIGLPELQELLMECGGGSFGCGLVRVHSLHTAGRTAPLISAAFPDFLGDFQPLAQDWLGRQFAIGTRIESRYLNKILLFEPGSGEAFEVDAGIKELFDVEFVNDPVGYLAYDLFEQWRNAHGVVPQDFSTCIGFKVPLFLGGEGAIANLEHVDLDVYWTISGQLRARVKGLPEGTQISDVMIE